MATWWSLGSTSRQSKLFRLNFKQGSLLSVELELLDE
jgi:hypothetical protein